MLTIDDITQLPELVGRDLGKSGYMTASQEAICAFADATGDHQWIHVDPERARRESPFGGPIAHGYWTLSVVPELLTEQLISFPGAQMAINYGIEKMRFPSPVPIGSEVFLEASIGQVDDKGSGVYDITFDIKVWVRDKLDKPAVVGGVIYRVMG